MDRCGKLTTMVLRDYRNGKGGYFQRAVIAFLLGRDGQICGICKEPIDDVVEIHVDHIVQRQNNGKDELSNFRLTHDYCNFRRYKNSRKIATYRCADCDRTALHKVDILRHLKVKGHNLGETTWEVKEYSRREETV